MEALWTREVIASDIVREATEDATFLGYVVHDNDMRTYPKGTRRKSLWQSVSEKPTLVTIGMFWLGIGILLSSLLTEILDRVGMITVATACLIVAFVAYPRELDRKRRRNG